MGQGVPLDHQVPPLVVLERGLVGAGLDELVAGLLALLCDFGPLQAVH